MRLKGFEKEHEFYSRVWFVYRHFALNPTELEKRENKDFYEAAHLYFSKKYCFVSDLKELFELESEEHVEINEEVINQIVLTCTQNPHLLVFNKGVPKNGVFIIK